MIKKVTDIKFKSSYMYTEKEKKSPTLCMSLVKHTSNPIYITIHIGVCIMYMYASDVAGRRSHRIKSFGET